MNHSNKIGYVVTDKDTKFIKKLLVKNPILIDASIRTKNDCNLMVSNVRKYNSKYKNGRCKKFVYEVDVIIEIKKGPSIYYQDKRRMNKNVRGYRNTQFVLDELCYFNIDDICISKITYK